MRSASTLPKDLLVHRLPHFKILLNSFNEVKIVGTMKTKALREGQAMK